MTFNLFYVSVYTVMLFIQSYFKLLISLARNRWRMLGISEFEPHQMFPLFSFAYEMEYLHIETFSNRHI